MHKEDTEQTTDNPQLLSSILDVAADIFLSLVPHKGVL